MFKGIKIFPMIVFLMLAVVLCGGFCFWKGRKYQVASVSEADFQRPDALQMEKQSDIRTYEEGEVVFQTDSREEAERVAEAVNSQLKSWQDGIAVISIEGTVDEFLKEYSDAPGLPTMYPNYVYSVN